MYNTKISLMAFIFVYVISAGTIAASQTSTTTTLIPLGDELAITTPIDNNESKPQTSESDETESSQNSIEEDTPVVLESMELRPEETGRRPWQAPNYAGQTGIMGYDSNTFSVPVELKPQVDFWISMYTKYSTDQGVLHDSRYINVVYEEIDFTKIENYQNLSSGQRHRAREKLVKEKKKQIVERLKRLQTVASADGLEGEDLRYWNMFKDVDESKKYFEAAQKGRLRFQLGQKDRFIQGIYYSGRYLQKMEQIFKEAGLPVELTRLPFVESSFNLKARSKVGASGIWQFMRYTGRLYMKLRYHIDERNDPIISTHAAARLLRFNYNLLNSWPLAVTAYNFGPTGMKREKDKLKTDNLAEIIQRSTNRRLGFASGNFYASFLAALEVEKNASKYFGQVDWSQELQFDEIELPNPTRFKTIVEHFNGDIERASLYNPHYTSVVKRGNSVLPAGTLVRVPLNTKEKFTLFLSSKSPDKSVRVASRSSIKRSGSGDEGITRYQINMGDTLSSIAKEFGVSISSIQELNGISNPRSIRVGQTIEIPVGQ